MVQVTKLLLDYTFRVLFTPLLFTLVDILYFILPPVGSITWVLGLLLFFSLKFGLVAFGLFSLHVFGWELFYSFLRALNFSPFLTV